MLEEAKASISAASDKNIKEIFSKHMLGLGNEKVETIELAFWIAHTVEMILDNSLDTAWKTVQEKENPDQETIDYIRNVYKVKCEIMDRNHPDYDPNEITFTQRVSLVEKLIGKTRLINFLWDLKDLRNAISHGRFENLTYKGKSLYSRPTREMLVHDLLECTANNDWENSNFWSNLTEDEKNKYRKRSS